MGSKSPARWLEQGRRHHRAGRLEEALEAYRRCLEHSPRQPQVLILTAMAASQAGRLEDAEGYARRAVASRDDPAARMTLGRVLLQAGNLEDALDCFRRVAKDSAMAPDAGFHAGQVLHRLGRRKEAAEMLEAAVRLRPDHAPAWNQLGVVRMALGQTGPACQAFRKSLEFRSRDPGTLVNLASACLRLGDHAAAMRALDTAREGNPDSPGVLPVLAAVERSLGRLPEALDAWEKSVQLEPVNANNWAGLGSARQASGDLAGAEAAYRRALEVDPQNSDAIAGMAEWLDWRGRCESGLEMLEQVPDDRRSPGIELVAGRLLNRLGDVAEAKRRLEAAIPAAVTDAPLRRQFAFSLGEACDRLDEVDDAWRWYMEGNGLTPAEFDPVAHRRWLDRLLDLAPSSRTDSRGRGIVFIVGMPRSGTTLVEQILAAHPDVAAAGELPFLGRLVQDLVSEQANGGSAAGVAPDIGSSYLERVAELKGSALVMTDKMPLNYQYLAIIRATLPGAKVVHCRRDLRDTALSCLFTDFIDPALGFATRLDWLADYMLAYREFMDALSALLPDHFLMNLDYESLVAEPEPEIRRLLAFAGLAWHPGCVGFHDHDRFAGTASHAQVRQPLYRTSVGRWRRYARQMEVLLERIGPID